MAKLHLKLDPQLDKDIKKGIAWSVHAFTTFGIVCGFLALVAVLKNDAFTAFVWLGVALFVDGIDGSLARKARVTEYTPNFDGASLDLVIDYFTYVAVPALMIYWFNMVPLEGLYFSGSTWSLIAAVHHHGGVVLHLCQCGHEIQRLLFRRLPGDLERGGAVFLSCSTPGHGPTGLPVLLLAVLTFIPVKFVHPLRVTHWRKMDHSHDGALGGHDPEPDHLAKRFPEKRWHRGKDRALAFRPATSLYFAVDFPVAHLHVLGDKGEDEETMSSDASPA